MSIERLFFIVYMLLIQITNVLSKLPLISVMWRVKQKSCGYGDYVTGMPKNIKGRKWIDVTASSEEECMIQVELSRKSNAGKVQQRTIVYYVMGIASCALYILQNIIRFYTIAEQISLVLSLSLGVSALDIVPLV